MKYYDISVLYNYFKVNFVDDELSRFSMGSFSHIEDKKKNFICRVQQLARLSVQLADSVKGGIFVQNGSESSLIANVEKGKIMILFFFGLIKGSRVRMLRFSPKGNMLFFMFK